MFTVRYLCQTGATQTISTTDSTTNTFGDSDDELNRITFEHTNKNIDSGRIKLFRQGVNVIKHHPVFGVGKGNIIYYGNRYNNDKMKYTDFHNGYLTIIVCSGFIGFALFIGFAVCLGFRMFKGLFGLKPPILRDIYPCLASFISSYCIYALFEKTMIFEVSFMIAFFWLVLGYAALCLCRYEDDDYKNRLLTLLQENCKFTEKELAVMLDTTEDVIRAQIEEFEQQGIIAGYKALINWEKVPGADVNALIELKVTPKRDKGFDEIAQRVMSFEEVEGVYLMAGDYDLGVFVKGHSIQDIAMFVAKRLSPLESVLSASTHFILTKYKSNNVDLQNFTSDTDGRECVV